MKVFLFNDTRYDYHHGCSMTMQSLFGALESRNIEILGTSPVSYQWKEETTIIKKIAKSDLVIVNGEGTLHHSRTEAFYLAEVAEYCENLNIDSYLINSVFSKNNKKLAEKVKKFNSIYVREGFSQRELKSYGIESKVVPDLIFYDKFVKSKKGLNKLIVTDAVSDLPLIPDSNKILFERSKDKDALYLPILTHPLPVNMFSLREWSVFFKYTLSSILFLILSLVLKIPFEKLQRKSFVLSNQVFRETISSSKGVITGRYHGLCISIMAETPFLILSSNSHKVEAILEDIGLGLDRIITQKDIDDDMNLLPPEFNEWELRSIRDYLKKAGHEIDEMFNEIFSKS